MKATARNALLILAVAFAGATGALAIERAAIAQGQAEGSASPTPNGSASPAAGKQRRDVADTRSTVSTSDPTSTLADLITFMRTGKGRLAAGAALVLIVWGLRSKYLLGKIAWFSTKLGGYVLGFGTTAIAYVGTALAGDAPLTIDLIADALATGFAAGGKWEAIRDVVTAQLKPRVAAAATTAILVGALMSYATVIACHPNGPGPVIGGSVIDCIALHGKMGPIIAELEPLLEGGTVDWSKIEATAEAQGLDIGACIVGELVQKYLAPPKGRAAPSVDRGIAARAALDRARAKVNGATLHTSLGDL